MGATTMAERFYYNVARATDGAKTEAGVKKLFTNPDEVALCCFDKKDDFNLRSFNMNAGKVDRNKTTTHFFN